VTGTAVQQDRNILDRLPHRPPFLFLSNVTALQAAESGRGLWSVDGSEAFLAGHFPDQPVVPGVLIVEALAQLSGLVAGRQKQADQNAGTGMLVHTDVRFKQAVVPPADITLESTLTRTIGALHQSDVFARVDERIVARGMLTLSIPTPDAPTEGGSES